MTFPSLTEQQQAFDTLRGCIDLELRSTGFEDFLASQGIDPAVGRLVVARSFDYSTELADVDIDLDPLAVRLATNHEVGVVENRPDSGWFYNGVVISSALHGGNQELVGAGTKLDYIQFVVVTASVSRLRAAKDSLQIPFLTKSLKKINLMGD